MHLLANVLLAPCIHNCIPVLEFIFKCLCFSILYEQVQECYAVAFFSKEQKQLIDNMRSSKDVPIVARDTQVRVFTPLDSLQSDTLGHVICLFRVSFNLIYSLIVHSHLQLLLAVTSCSASDWQFSWMKTPTPVLIGL